MSTFLIAEIKITNDAWVPEYAANVHNLVAKQGGKYLSRSGNITPLEGARKDCTLIAIIQFPTKAAFEAFVNDPLRWTKQVKCTREAASAARSATRALALHGGRRPATVGSASG